MARYPLWCLKCDKLTLHEIHGLKSNCCKCNEQRPTPVVKWVVLGSLLAILSYLSFMVIVWSTSSLLNTIF